LPELLGIHRARIREPLQLLDELVVAHAGIGGQEPIVGPVDSIYTPVVGAGARERNARPAPARAAIVHFGPGDVEPDAVATEVEVSAPTSSKVTTDLHLKVLLNWAVDFVADEIRVRRDSYTDQAGNFDADFENEALEIHDAERWLAEARAVLK
jgi:hypothetical protein